ncbi:MAG: hypothetical protein IPH30_07485 [Betaproteobacteria bacterium]|jgi:hypothetical protein|nr:hypothetical protein [Betaproteobacteria bacterium]
MVFPFGGLTTVTAALNPFFQGRIAEVEDSNPDRAGLTGRPLPVRS